MLMSIKATRSCELDYMETVSAMLFKSEKWALGARVAAYLVGAFPKNLRAGGDASILELAKKGNAEVFTTSMYITAQSMRFATAVRMGS